ncbi:PspC domain-containing protein [Pedobacter hiemivivus]|uniref:PspC domain-containing protein n=1 Tax=Pedobacter hiemivivus TaxID=2530454 RepID=A0A4R0N6A8_9SPHI|nr:PspC domain-containing protein [Pedobacter hiemivivus]TCC95561.1 PspC domain-containing protein [Pedobacter hiemivivus]
MKKTHNINIGNSIIHIEEDAYEILTVYLNEVKQHFSKNADDFEIVTDIENRIAEMFAEKLFAQQKQVVNVEDVQSVIQQMGSVKDFETSEESAEEQIPTPEYNSIKKLYRDTDQAMVAGVCAGLGHYLDIDAKWVRLFTFLTTFIFGSGLLVYMIFWIMVPKAKTRIEKMEMRGEETNLKGFANSYLHPFAEQSRGFIAGLIQAIGEFLQGTGKVIFKIIVGSIVVFASFFLLGTIVALAAFLGFWNSDVHNYFPISMVNEEYLFPMTIAAFIVLIIPLLALILFSIRVGFNGRPINKVLSYGLLVIWLGGVVTGIYYIAKVSTEFKEGAEFAQTTPLKTYPVYSLNINMERFFTREDSLNYRIDPARYKGRKILNNRDDNFNNPRSISFRIEKSTDGKVSLSTNFKSRGKTFEVALKNAQNIHYDFLQEGATLSFSPVLHIPKMSNWRGQEVELTLSIPVGTEVQVSNEFYRYLRGYGYWDCEHEEGAEYSSWIMTDTGVKCKFEKVKKED